MKSIRYFYFISIAAILVASMVLLGLMQAYLSSAHYRKDKYSMLGRLVLGVAQGMRDEGTARFLQDGTLDYMAESTGAIVFLADAEGRVLYSTATYPLLNTQLPEETLEKLNGQTRLEETSRLNGLFDTNHYISAMASYNQDGELLGYVLASSDATGLALYLYNIMSGFVVSAVLVLMAGSIVALLLSNKLVVPLQRLADSAREFGGGNYSVRVPVEGDDELTHLAVTFNEMANSLESTDISRRSFMGNIAHELRTPMTTIKGFVDGMLDGTIPPQLQTQYLGIVSQEVGRLSRLTKNMLDISRLEAGEYTPEITTFDIWKPILDILAGQEARLTESGVNLDGLDKLVPVYVQADEDFVHQVLFNLVDNAIKFVDEGGTITFWVKPESNRVEIAIRNTGRPISQEALPHLFERFYKEDESRSLNKKGAGLGLHICKVLVGFMGGRIWATTGSNHSELHFTLPVGAPPRKPAE